MASDPACTVLALAIRRERSRAPWRDEFCRGRAVPPAVHVRRRRWPSGVRAQASAVPAERSPAPPAIAAADRGRCQAKIHRELLQSWLCFLVTAVAFVVAALGRCQFEIGCAGSQRSSGHRTAGAGRGKDAAHCKPGGIASRRVRDRRSAPLYFRLDDIQFDVLAERGAARVGACSKTRTRAVAAYSGRLRGPGVGAISSPPYLCQLLSGCGSVAMLPAPDRLTPVFQLGPGGPGVGVCSNGLR